MPVNAPYSSSMEKEIQKAANIINSFFKNSTVDADSAIPAELIKNCAGLAFITVIKAGVIWTGKVGTGIVIARLEDGSWSPPSGIGTAGVGFGAEIGGEIVDFMIVLGSKSALKTFKKGTQVSVGAGLELAVGPLGRAAGASMNAGGGGVGANYTYSRAKGAFAGVGLHGSTILVRGEMNAKFYGRDITPMEILNGHVQAPPGSCDVLYEAIRMAEGQQGVSIYPSSDPRSAHYNGGSGRNSFENRASYNGSFNVNTNTNTNNTSSGYGASSSSSTARASLSAPTSAAPSTSDPRLHRYASYKSEKELYEQYAKNKSPAAATTSTAPPSYGAGYAAPAPVGYAAPAAASYGTSYAQPPPAPQPAYTPAPTSNYASSYAQPAAAPAASPYGAYGYGAAAPAPTPTPTPVQQAPPARPVVKTVPVTAYVPNYGAAPAPTPKPPVPPPAVGAETKQVYTQVINFVSTKCPHANVQIFKDNCRLFGQDQMSLDAYLAYLTSICTTPLLKELVPQLVRLLPTQDKREALWGLYVREVLMIR